ncbi:hypothetical protein GCM10022222_09510 [Amycolatopsis ultiminotia]|uniref:Uncharacterized protein n=1 Tax=Amycolatopsis ultiminotia TaxID=543629 RepID=A0ABP6V470_9PSEU
MNRSIGSPGKSADVDDELRAGQLRQPGLTGTDMVGGFGRPQPAAGAKIATLGPDGPTGQFLGADGFARGEPTRAGCIPVELR